MKRKRRQIRERPGRAFEATGEDNDPIERLMFTASPPHKYGYFLIVVATMMLILLVLGIRAGALNWYAVTVMTAFMLFLVLVGFKLIKKQPKSEPPAGRKRSPIKLDD